MNCTLGRSPFVPNHPVFPLPENTGQIDLGFPPLSHPHLSRRVPLRNDELPKSQAHLTDFGEVLRKKHAAIAALVGGGPVRRAARVDRYFSCELKSLRVACEIRQLRPSYGTPGAHRQRDTGKAYTPERRPPAAAPDLTGSILRRLRTPWTRHYGIRRAKLGSKKLGSKK